MRRRPKLWKKGKKREFQSESVCEVDSKELITQALYDFQLGYRMHADTELEEMDKGE